MGNAIFYKNTRYPTGGSGGGGGGNAVINPKYLPTEKLYEAGGVTTWADTNSYTATQPCIAYIDYYGDGYTNMVPILNGNWLSPQSINKDNYKHLTVFLKSGDTIGKRVDTGGGSPYFYMTIYAYEIDGSGGGSSVNYSTSEQVIGTWIDGKPLYQKTYELNFTPNSNDYIYTIETLSNEIMVRRILDGGMYCDSVLFIPVIYPPSDIGYSFRFEPSSHLLTARLFNRDGNAVTGTVTIQYTKSTD